MGVDLAKIIARAQKRSTKILTAKSSAKKRWMKFYCLHHFTRSLRFVFIWKQTIRISQLTNDENPDVLPDVYRHSFALWLLKHKIHRTF
jgi:hypothetical protein